MMKKVVVSIIAVFIILLLGNLVWTVVSVETSLPLKWSHSIIENNATVSDKWAIRGQIGDIMSGHFAALAFLGVALSIFLQVEGNKQMRESIEKQERAIKQQKVSIEKQTEANLDQAKSTLQQAEAIKLQATSIEQQNEALKIQYETLQAQTKELEEARKESSKQTEEFAINNMNIKLDRYYKLLTEKLIKLDGNQMNIYKNKKVVKQRLENGDDNIIGVTLPNIKKDLEELESLFNSIYEVLEFIFLDIESMKKKPDAYNVFSGEFKIRIKSDHNLIQMLMHYPPNEEKYKVGSFLHELTLDTFMG